MKVTLDIFSGRPNPSWTMSPESEKELGRRLVGLPRARELPDSDNLGYRGFVIINETGAGTFPVEVRVYKGLVATTDKAGISAFRDTNHLEKWLAEQAREHGLEGLIDSVPEL